MAKILIIDDNEDLRQMIRLILTKEGHEVAVAADGEEGLQSFKHNPAEVVLVDILMPGRGGLETIKDLLVGQKRPHIIAISGGFLGGQDQVKALAATLGVDATLAKPFSPDYLLAVVRGLLAS